VDVAKERYRDLRGLRIIETLFHDVRYSVRTLLKSRGFALTAITSIALGIGANSAIFSLQMDFCCGPFRSRVLRRSWRCEA
jgi:hypothetical protein